MVMDRARSGISRWPVKLIELWYACDYDMIAVCAHLVGGMPQQGRGYRQNDVSAEVSRREIHKRLRVGGRVAGLAD